MTNSKELTDTTNVTQSRKIHLYALNYLIIIIDYNNHLIK